MKIKYLVSGIVGFFLTLVVSMPFQNLMKQGEAKALSASASKRSEGRTATSSSDLDVKIQPIVRIEDKKDEPRIKFLPQYPAEAAEKKIEGFVTVSFRVSKDGSVQNLKVTESSPPQVFDESALNAVSKWNFAGAKARPSAMDLQKLRLNFTLGRSVALDQRLNEM